MIKHCYSIFDKATKTYLPPFTETTENAAIRQFAMSVNHVGGFINQYPGDYSLFQVGTYDDHTGALFPAKPVMFIIEAVKLVKEDPSPAPRRDTILKEVAV